MACGVCGDTRTVAKARCHCCYEYRRRTGTDRTEKHVVRLTARDIERGLTRRHR
jgi:hypothetical protein